MALILRYRSVTNAAFYHFLRAVIHSNVSANVDHSIADDCLRKQWT